MIRRHHHIVIAQVELLDRQRHEGQPSAKPLPERQTLNEAGMHRAATQKRPVFALQ
ncbi:MAG: hypothetical protein PF961_02595 [Planctomycetota bacterium]|jgi:hypothetical protein|nr:hypothetical protein [Planctomycetota bacterium]